MRCKGTPQAGVRCKNSAVVGDYCRRHGETPGGGRQTKLTAEVQDTIVRAIEVGNYASVAAGAAGIGERTYWRWMEQGERDAEAGKDSIYQRFRQAVKKAEDEAEVAAVAYVRRAMPGNWQAAMTYLERKHPAKWGRRDRHEHTGADGGPIEITEAQMQDPELRASLREAGRRLAADREGRAGESGPPDRP